MLSSLSSLHWNTLRLHYRLDAPMVLPAFKGSPLHGVLGHALMKNPDMYNALFECKTPEDHPFARRFQQMPNPYVLYPLDYPQTHFAKGESLSFDLTLVGNAEEWLTTLIGLLMKMGGVRIGNRQYNAEMKLLKLIEKKPFVLPALPEAEFCTLTLSLESPLRLKKDAKLADIQHFPTIIHRLAERLAILAHFHCNAPLELDFTNMLALAQKANCTQDKTDRTHISRYSKRSEMKMEFEGWSGKVTFENVAVALLPLFHYGSELHFGKATTMGFGKFGFEYHVP